VATIGERLAVLEQIERDNRDQIANIIDLVNGGRGTPYDRSVRGRLHKIEGTLASLVLRRNFGVGMLKGWERAALVAAAFATVAASWYAALSH
jgi:hypothetical protein